MLALLADGRPHTRAELHSCLFDTYGPLTNIKAHLTAIRKQLRPMGMEVVCEVVNRRICYRQIRLLPPADGT